MKQINSLNDLAINGADPAFQNPIHVGRPNMGNIAYFESLVKDMFQSSQFTNNGPLLVRLEDELKKYLNVRNCIAVCNGTVGLELAIKSLDLKGEIIVPSYSFIATAQTVSWLGIKPVFVDIDRDTHNIDTRNIKDLITKDTTAIIAAHLWGRAANTSELLKISQESGLKLIYDAAHAFGCSSKGSMIGNFGDIEVFSFHSTKFFNSFEGGAITTNNDELAEKIRRMRNFGFSGFDNVVEIGTNAKMTEICAAMGLANLKNIDLVLEKNRENYNLYTTHLRGIEEVRIMEYDLSEKNNFQYIVIELIEPLKFKRDLLVSALQAENILARKYFWPGIHRMPVYKDGPFRSKGLEVTEDVADRTLVLPTGPSISEDHIETICSIINLIMKNEIYA